MGPFNQHPLNSQLNISQREQAARGAS